MPKRARKLGVFAPILLLITFTSGCATGPATQLEVGSGDTPAVFEYRDVYWRPAAGVEGGVEVIGYGFLPYYNNPMSREYDPRWSTTGTVVIRLHGISQPDGGFAITMLGPAMTLGPGDDEMITGTAKGVQIEAGEKGGRTIKVPATAVQSRNRAGMALSMKGTIYASQTDDGTFNRQLNHYNTERGYRDLPHATKPGSQ